MGSITPPFPSPTKKWWNKEQPATSPTRPELSAKGKSIIVTGGGSTGIGGETARYFARAGASRIALLGRREGPLRDNKTFIEKNFTGVEVFIKSADVTDQHAVNAAFAEFTGNGQTQVDVLIHSAAIVGPKEPIPKANDAEYLGAINNNVASSYWLAQAFSHHAASEATAIIISSWAAHWSVNDMFGSYCVSKIAMFRLWDIFGLSHPNISVFHTQPGVVLTEMNKKVGGAASMEGVPIDDVSLPAAFNLWLASPEARFLEGKFLWCNWDVDELKERAAELAKGTELSINLVGWPFGDEDKLPGL